MISSRHLILAVAGLLTVAALLALHAVPAVASDDSSAAETSAAADPTSTGDSTVAPDTSVARDTIVAPDPSATPDLLSGETEPPARGTFAGATRTFFSDGAYLFTFPARATPRGVAMTAAWGGATLLALHNDDWIFNEVATQDEPGRDGTARLIEPLGRTPLQAGVLGILYASGRMADRPGLASVAATSFEALLWAGLVSNAGKMVFGREQPSSTMDARYFFEGQGSFPSGHAARSFAIAAVMADRYGRRGAWIGYTIAGAVSLSMVQREIHWASDVVAGAGMGLAIGKGIAARHPDPAREARLGAGPARRFAWQVHPARDGAALTLIF